MKSNKALKRLTHVEELLADVTERYSADASHVREALQAAKLAVTRAKDAVSSEASSETTGTPKKSTAKDKTVKVPRPKASKKHGPTKRDYEG
jgi:hypothetical protein